MKEIDKVMMSLLDRFSKMEEKVRLLKEEGLACEEMITSLHVEVEDLQMKICHCNKPESCPLSRSRTHESSIDLEYVD